MIQSTTNPPAAVKILSCIALGLAAIYNLIVLFPLNIFALLDFVITLAPYVLLVLFVFIFHKEPVGKMILPLIFASFALAPLLSIFSALVYRYPLPLLSYFFHFIQMSAFGAAACSTWKMPRNKVIPIVAICVRLFLTLYSAYNYLRPWFSVMGDLEFYLRQFYTVRYMLPIAMHPLSTIGSACLLVGLLLLVRQYNPQETSFPGIPTQPVYQQPVYQQPTYRQPTYQQPVYQQPQPQPQTPEQELYLLQTRYQQGLIPEAEYQAKRAEIISKL